MVEVSCIVLERLKLDTSIRVFQAQKG